MADEDWTLEVGGCSIKDTFLPYISLSEKRFELRWSVTSAVLLDEGLIALDLDVDAAANGGEGMFPFCFPLLVEGRGLRILLDLTLEVLEGRPSLLDTKDKFLVEAAEIGLR